jgi:hypothetical protein
MSGSSWDKSADKFGWVCGDAAPAALSAVASCGVGAAPAAAPVTGTPEVESEACPAGKTAWPDAGNPGDDPAGDAGGFDGFGAPVPTVDALAPDAAGAALVGPTAPTPDPTMPKPMAAGVDSEAEGGTGFTAGDTGLPALADGDVEASRDCPPRAAAGADWVWAGGFCVTLEVTAAACDNAPATLGATDPTSVAMTFEGFASCLLWTAGVDPAGAFTGADGSTA